MIIKAELHDYNIIEEVAIKVLSYSPNFKYAYLQHKSGTIYQESRYLPVKLFTQANPLAFFSDTTELFPAINLHVDGASVAAQSWLLTGSPGGLIMGKDALNEYTNLYSIPHKYSGWYIKFNDNCYFYSEHTIDNNHQYFTGFGIIQNGETSYIPTTGVFGKDIAIIEILPNVLIIGGIYRNNDSNLYTPQGQIIPPTYGFYNLGSHIYGYTDTENRYSFYSIMNWSTFFGFSGDLPQPNPYGDNSTAEERLGGNGSFDFTSDVISENSLPTYSALSTQMITCLVPTNEQMTAIGKKFWSNSVLNSISSLFANNPLTAIISLKQFPFKINSDLTTSEVVIAGVNLGVPCNATTKQFMTLNFGTLDFTDRPLRDNFLDYSPYTNIVLHLAYLGDIELDCADVWNHKVSVKYRIDIISGICLAIVLIDDSIRYTLSGSCTTDIPLTYKDTAGSVRSIGNVIGSISNPFSAISSLANIQPVPSVYYKNGGSSVSLLESNICYLSISTANESVSGDINDLQGFRSNVTSILKNLHGYAEIISTHVENVDALDEELDEILALLKEGVILP